MTERERISTDLGHQILETHQRFSAAIKERLPSMDFDQKERYFALLSVLVGKLEDPSKSMRQVLQELVAEALPIVMAELQES